MKISFKYLLLALLIMLPLIVFGLNISIEAFNQLVQPPQNIKMVSIEAIGNDSYEVSLLGIEKKIPKPEKSVYFNKLKNFSRNIAGDWETIVERKLGFWKNKFKEEKEKLDNYWQKI